MKGHVLEVHLHMMRYLCGHCEYKCDIVEDMRAHSKKEHKGNLKIIKNIERFSNEVFSKIKIRKDQGTVEIMHVIDNLLVTECYLGK